MTTMTVRQISEMAFFTLLSKDKAAQQQVISEFYDPDAIFDDPLVSVKGSKAILAQFSILSSIFHSIKAQPQCVLLSQEGTRDVVVIDALLSFELYLFGSIQMRAITKYELYENKIVKQEDVWSLLDVLQRLPLFGWVYNFIRRLNGSVTALAVGQLERLQKRIKVVKN